MNSNIPNISNKILHMAEGSMTAREYYITSLNEKLIELSSKIINNNFKDEQEKLQTIQQQAYVTGQLEEIMKRYKEMCKLKEEIKTLNNLIEIEKDKEKDKEKNSI